MNKTSKIFYWTATSLLGLQMLTTGIGDFLLAEQIVENISRVGFPVSLIPFLGALKITGTLVLLFARNIHLRIATYAGMFFYALGAIYSHIAIGDPIFPSTVAGIFMLFLIATSYFLWQRHYFPFTSIAH